MKLKTESIKVGDKVKLTNPNMDFEKKFDFPRFPKDSICVVEKVIPAFNSIPEMYGLSCEDGGFGYKWFFYNANEFEIEEEI